MQSDDETAITEISFLPDGRVCVFGMSREVLQLLGELALGDPALSRRYEQSCQPSDTRAFAAGASAGRGAAEHVQLLPGQLSPQPPLDRGGKS